MFKFNPYVFALMTVLSANSFAEQLEEITVDGEAEQVRYKNVQADSLKQKSVTLGEALSHQLGVSSNTFGGGASAPVIRGQEGYRIKVVQNGAEVTDMASLSPDHAIMVEPNLANQISLEQGPKTLLFGSGTTGGVVNVEDSKIRIQPMLRPIEGEVDARYGSANRETLGSAKLDFALGSNVVLHLEGLARQSYDYRVPFFLESYERDAEDTTSDDYDDVPLDDDLKETVFVPHKRVPNSDAKSNQGTIGLSWVDNKGYVGVAFTDRQDFYGLPGHQHKFHSCHFHTAREDSRYPEGAHLHCEHEKFDPINPENNHLHAEHPEDHGFAKLDLHLKRYDFRAGINQPFEKVEQIRLTGDYTDYVHDERENSLILTTFKNRAYNVRLEADHRANDKLSGTFAFQYGKSHIDTTGEESILDVNRTEKWAISALQQLKLDEKLSFEVAGRVEHQRVKLQNDVFTQRKRNPSIPLEHKKYNATAYSYALGSEWKITPTTTIAGNFSHQERIPSVQELYARGTHIATNSLEFGDEQYDRAIKNAFAPKSYAFDFGGDIKNFEQFGINQRLKKEKSNNLEISLRSNTDKFHFYLATYYKQYKNYIYAHTIHRFEGFRLIRYAQQPARFYGVEAALDYQLTKDYQLGVFGDFVRGKLKDGNAPRVPAGRLGMRVKANFSDHLSGFAEFTHYFKQNKVAHLEDPTPSFNLLNLGLSYQGGFGNDNAYRIFFNLNNALNQKVYSHSSHLPHIPLAGRGVVMGVNILF